MESVRRLGMSALVFLVASGAGAQFRQYTQPGGPGTKPVAAKEELEKSLADARWRLGPLRVSPWLGIRQIGWVDNVFAGTTSDQDKVSDVTATVGAGLTAYLPTGPDVFWMAEARPEYVWWQKLSDRRQSTGRYGVGVFAFFNRLELRVTGGREEAQGIASSEFPQLIVSRRDHLDAVGDLRLTGKLDLALSGTWTDLANESDQLADPRIPLFANLDRRENVARAALGFKVTRRNRVAVGFESSRSDSAAEARDLSNSGTAPSFEWNFKGARSTLDLHLFHRSLEPRNGSAFAPYKAWNGDLQATLEPNGRLAYQLYGSVEPSLSLLADYSHYEERRLGVAVRAPLSPKLDGALFAEGGQNRYFKLDPAAAPRQDDVHSYGVQLDYKLTRSLTFSLRASRDEYNSSSAGFDRTVTNVQTGLTLSSSRLLWR
jgi:hypothetical protein